MKLLLFAALLLPSVVFAKRPGTPCIYAGYVSTFNSRGYCIPPIALMNQAWPVVSSNGRVIQQKMCSGGGMLCNPLAYGFGPNGSGICVTSRTRPTTECEQKFRALRNYSSAQVALQLRATGLDKNLSSQSSKLATYCKSATGRRLQPTLCKAVAGRTKDVAFEVKKAEPVPMPQARPNIANTGTGQGNAEGRGDATTTPQGNAWTANPPVSSDFVPATPNEPKPQTQTQTTPDYPITDTGVLPVDPAPVTAPQAPATPAPNFVADAHDALKNGTAPYGSVPPNILSPAVIPKDAKFEPPPNSAWQEQPAEKPEPERNAWNANPPLSSDFVPANPQTSTAANSGPKTPAEQTPDQEQALATPQNASPQNEAPKKEDPPKKQATRKNGEVCFDDKESYEDAKKDLPSGLKVPMWLTNGSMFGLIGAGLRVQFIGGKLNFEAVYSSFTGNDGFGGYLREICVKGDSIRLMGSKTFLMNVQPDKTFILHVEGNKVPFVTATSQQYASVVNPIKETLKKSRGVR